MWFVYAIHSDDGRYYSGISERPADRLREHNSGKCDSTSGGRWEHLFVIPFADRATAYLVERWLKCGNTPKKRAVVIRMVETMEPETVASNMLTAAKEWQQKCVIHNNEHGGF